MKIRLNKKAIQAIEPPARGRLRVYDTEVPGFGVVVNFGGSRRFYLRRQVRGREHLIDLGSWPEVDPATAREAARAARSELEAGSGAAFNRASLGAVWRAFVEERAAGLQPRTLVEYQRLWRAHLAELADYRLREIDRAAVARLHGQTAKTSSRYVANRVRALLSSILHHAVDIGLLDAVPTLPTPYRETRRHRWLDRQELRRLLDVLYSDDQDEVALTASAAAAGRKFTPLTAHQKAYFLVLLFTGSRRGEVAAMRWDQLDLECGVWLRIQKGGILSPTVLASPTVEILQTLLPPGGRARSPWVFPGPGKSGHLEEPKTAWRRVCGRANITGARIHDLRHTHASWMAQAGVSLQIIGGQLGHRQTATTERYAHLTLDPVRQAVEAVVAEMRR